MLPLLYIILHLTPNALRIIKAPFFFHSFFFFLLLYIAQDQRVVDLVTEALFHVPAGTYISTSTLFKDGTNCDALYIPVSSNLSGLSPVIIEFQRTVSMEFLRRSNRYCLNTYDRFCSSPVLVVFCTNGIASASISNNFTSHHRLPYCQAVPCFPFADDFIMVTKDTIQPLVNKDDKLPPLAALAHFIIAGKLNIIDIEHNDNETIQSLYRLAMELFPCDVRDGDGFEPAITALNEMGQQFKKITKEIPSNPYRAITYSEDGEAYCIKMKRKFDEAMDSNRAVTPMYEPEVPKYDLTSNETHYDINSQEGKDQLIKFVDEFKVALNGGRMNWHDCWKKGRSHGIITHYNNHEVMKNAYHRAKQ